MSLGEEDRAVLRETFRADASSRAARIAAALELVGAAADPDRLADARRSLANEAHALRGAAATVGLQEIETLAIELEDATMGTQTGSGQQVMSRAARELVDLLRSLSAAPASLDGSVAEPPRRAGGRPLILHVEDDATNVKLVEQIVALRPALDLVHARSGAEGLARAAELLPELIILDGRLPDTGGEQVIRELRRNPTTRVAHVVVLSGATGVAEKEALLAAGADAFLAKPVGVQDLLAAIDAGLVTS
jgi:CheY-like chemotaxis protein